MSLRHALLGLLAVEPASGYDLARRFEGDLGRYAWHAGHTRIYPELGAMAEVGLVEVTGTGARGRKTYDVTGTGRDELRSWLMQPPEQTQVRNETVLRMFLLQALEPDDARFLLEKMAAHCVEEIARLRPVMDELDARTADDSGVPFGRFAGEFGLRQYEAVHAWAQWSLARLDASVSSRAGGPS